MAMLQILKHAYSSLGQASFQHAMNLFFLSLCGTAQIQHRRVLLCVFLDCIGMYIRCHLLPVSQRYLPSREGVYNG
jgi:hypothetical protein